MTTTDVFTISGIMGGISTVLGLWLKSRLDSSIQHEYARLLELFKAEQKRSELLHAERLNALKSLSAKLLALRRYSHARSAEVRNQSEFEPRTESLASTENLSLLQHWEVIRRTMEEHELFLSPASRESFNVLFRQMTLGFNLELWIASGQDQVKLNASELFDIVAIKTNDVMSALFRDLELPVGVVSQTPNPSLHRTASGGR